MADLKDDPRRLLGGFIRAQRQMANLSLRQLSALTEVSNPYLSQVERGLHEPSVRVLRSIAEALDLSSETLFEQAGLIKGTPRQGTPRQGTPEQDVQRDQQAPDETAQDTRRHTGDRMGEENTERVIRTDRRLTEPQRRALLSVYRSYVEANAEE